MKITMNSLEAKRIADAYLKHNTPYEEVKFADIRNSDCTYKFLYKAADTFDRVVDIYTPLMRFVATLPQDAEDK